MEDDWCSILAVQNDTFFLYIYPSDCIFCWDDSWLSVLHCLVFHSSWSDVCGCRRWLSSNLCNGDIRLPPEVFRKHKPFDWNSLPARLLRGKRLYVQILTFRIYFYMIQLTYSWVIISCTILILLTATSHLDRMDRSDKVLISYKIPHLHPGWHDRNNECRVKLW